MNIDSMDDEVRGQYFVQEIQKRGYDRRYKGDELGEFWLGVLKASRQAKNDIGDPVEFVTWKGRNAVADYRRRKMLDGSVGHCPSCDDFVSFKPMKNSTHLVCRRCETIIDREYRFVRPKRDSNSRNSDVGEIFDTMAYRNHAYSVHDELDHTEYLRRIQEAAKQIYEATYIESDRQAALLDILSGKNVDPCNVCDKQCKGLIPFNECESLVLRISRAWGVSPGTISTYFRRLRNTLIHYDVLP